jgi:hypothetical protein
MTLNKKDSALKKFLLGFLLFLIIGGSRLLDAVLFLIYPPYWFICIFLFGRGVVGNMMIKQGKRYFESTLDKQAKKILKDKIKEAQRLGSMKKKKKFGW